MRHEGRTAIITGASRGIGLAIAQRLVADGARVVITARRQEGLEKAVAELGGPDVAIAMAGRADDAEHRAATVRRAVEEFGGADLLVNNIGINPVYGPVVELDLDVARKVLDVNCLANLAWVQEVHRAWMREHGGAIVNVSSISAVRPAPGIGLYGATKAMLASLTELLALELAPTVRVNAVAPGVVKTRFAGALYEGREAEVAAGFPLGRLGEPADVAGAVAFLLSDDASWITGRHLVIDGGLTLGGVSA